ncbi:MAG: L,D-transpeptidase [Candidatus Zipacnadales bacterium]
MMFVALVAVGPTQELDGPLDKPAELEKTPFADDIMRDPRGKLLLPPPPPARPALMQQIVAADEEVVQQAWLRAQPPSITLLTPQPQTEWTEGESAEITWETTGPISYVRLYYYGDRCRLGGQSRGMFEGFITEKAPNTGRFTWKVPWVDALSLNLRIAGLNENDEKLADDAVGVRFRPRIMANLKDKGTLIAISKTHQRLYLQQAGKIVRQHIISTAAGGYWTPTMKPGSVDGRRGRMGQVFSKSLNAWSSRYHCWMPYWMAITASGSHGIHATSPPFYRALGQPASHGCIRQHHADARVIYSMVPVGTPVYIFP